MSEEEQKCPTGSTKSKNPLDHIDFEELRRADGRRLELTDDDLRALNWDIA